MVDCGRVSFILRRTIYLLLERVVRGLAEFVNSEMFENEAYLLQTNSYQVDMYF